MSSLRERLGKHGPRVVGLLLALPTLLAFYPPMTDLPGHEGIVGILRHWGDEAYFPAQLYALNLGHSNQLFHIASWLLSLLVGTRWAVKIVIAAAQIAIFDAGGRLARHLGRPRWTALLLAPLALGFAYYWGFVANLLGYAALLYALPLMDRATREPSPRLAAAASGALVVLFLAHGSVFVMAVAALFFLGIVHPLERRQRLLALVPFAFGIVFGAAIWWRASRLFTSEVPAYRTYFFGLSERLTTLPGSFLGLEDPWAHAGLLALAAVAAVALIEWRLRAVQRTDAPRTLRERIAARRFELLAALSFAAYLIAPYHFQGTMFIHHRFLGPAWAAFVLTAAPVAGEIGGPGSPRARRAAAIARGSSLAFALGVVVAGAPQFVDSDRTHRDLEATLQQIPMKSAVTFLSIDRGRARPERAYDPSPGFARVVALRGGRGGPSFASSPICAVQVRPEYRWREHTFRIVGRGSQALAPAHDLDRFGWVVVRTLTPGMPAKVSEAFASDAELVFERGEWLLFRSTHTLAALESGDVPAPRDATTIVARVLLAEESRRARQHATDGGSR